MAQPPPPRGLCLILEQLKQGPRECLLDEAAIAAAGYRVRRVGALGGPVRRERRAAGAHCEWPIN